MSIRNISIFTPFCMHTVFYSVVLTRFIVKMSYLADSHLILRRPRRIFGLILLFTGLIVTGITTCAKTIKRILITLDFVAYAESGHPYHSTLVLDTMRDVSVIVKRTLFPAFHWSVVAPFADIFLKSQSFTNLLKPRTNHGLLVAALTSC